MKQITIQYLMRGKEKEREITVAEWHKLLVSDKYATAVNRLRRAVALSRGRHEGDLEGVPALPDVRMYTGAHTYSGLLVLTLAVGEGTPWPLLRRTVAMLPQTLLMFGGSSGRTLKVVCRATLPDGTLPGGDRESRLLFSATG